MVVNWEQTHKALGLIGKTIVAEGRRNLQAHNTTSNLSKSLKYKIKVLNGKMVLQVISADYGDVLDKGISGLEVSQPGAKYKFAKGNAANRISGYLVYTNYEKIKQWVLRKGIPVKAAYSIHRALKRRGYPPTKWLTRAKEKAYLNHRQLIAKSASKDIVKHIKITAK